MLPTPNVSLTTTISNKSRSFGVTPMEHGLRVAGTVEIAGLEAAPDERRAKALLANVRTMFPEVNTDGHRFWMGFRPSTPDSLPMLGEATGRPGLFLAVGHGHFGMTGGPPSGRLISQLINGTPTAIDAAVYAPQRFA
jgi:D-amino-acid dehydrogenase